MSVSGLDVVSDIAGPFALAFLRSLNVTFRALTLPQGDTMTPRTLLVFLASIGSIGGLLLTPSVTRAIDHCQVKISTKDGTLLVSARGIAGPARWGTAADQTARTFANAATCLTGAKAEKCTLGAPGSADAITPPRLCTLYVTDGATTCATYIKGCVPSTRAGVVVRDATGALVGLYVGADPRCRGALILRTVAGRTVTFCTDPSFAADRDNGREDFEVFFQEPNCTGAAFIDSDIPNTLGISSGTTGGLARLPNLTLYYATGATSPSVAVQSSAFEASQAECNNGSGTFIPPASCCRPLNETRELAPATTDDLSALVAPFRIRVE
jgi:hypothetical protein